MSRIIIAVDTEGTGVDTKKDRVAEIAAVKYELDTQTIVDTYHQVINPGVPMPIEASKVHGLYDADLADKPKFAEIVNDFFTFIEGGHVIIHNARYDTAILDAECKRRKVELFSTMPASIVDTLAMARFVYPGKKNTLDVLCDRLGVDRSKRTLHGALIDCELLAAVYEGLSKVYMAKEDRISSILPQHLAAPFPEKLDSAVELYFAVQELEKHLTKYSNSLKEKIAALAQTARDGDFYTIEYKTQTTTNWAKVVEDLLNDVDLSKYKSTSKPSISIKEKKLD